MKTHYNTGNYGNELRLTKSDALRCSHSGDCERDVIEVSQKPYVKKQLALLNPENLAKELKEYGAWDAEQLADHSENLIRWVWLSACDIAERLA
jgi:hypothetical protein